MPKFFDYSISENHVLTLCERIIPTVICLIIIMIIVFLRNKIVVNSLTDRIIRYSYGGLLAIMYTSQALLLYFGEGCTRWSLPLHLCSFLLVMCFVSMFILNNKLISFVISIALPTAIVTLTIPNLYNSYKHFQYYAFMIIHYSFIIVTMYFILVHKCRITLKKFIFNIIVLEFVAIIAGILNDIFGTYYFFFSFKYVNVGSTGMPVFFGNSVALYLISFEILGLSALFIWFLIYKLIVKLINRHEIIKEQQLELVLEH